MSFAQELLPDGGHFGFCDPWVGQRGKIIEEIISLTEITPISVWNMTYLEADYLHYRLTKLEAELRPFWILWPKGVSESQNITKNEFLGPNNPYKLMKHDIIKKWTIFPTGWPSRTAAILDSETQGWVKQLKYYKKWIPWPKQPL